MNQTIKPIKGITVEDINDIFGENNIKNIRESDGQPWIYISFNPSATIRDGEIQALTAKGFKITFVNFALNTITIDSIRGY